MKAVLFDMDGVIVDSEHQWKLLSHARFVELMPHWTERDYHRIVGMGVHELYDHLVRDHQLKLSKEECFADWERIARTVYTERVTLSAGLHRLLDALDAAGIPCAVVSSSPTRWIRLVVERFGLTPRFRLLASADDVGGEGKPSPAVYLHAAGALGVAPKDCVAIEDSVYGVRAAKAAGIYCFAYRNGSNDAQDLSLADAELRTLSEFPLVRAS